MGILLVSNTDSSLVVIWKGILLGVSSTFYWPFFSVSFVEKHSDDLCLVFLKNLLMFGAAIFGEIIFLTEEECFDETDSAAEFTDRTVTRFKFEAYFLTPNYLFDRGVYI